MAEDKDRTSSEQFIKSNIDREEDFRRDGMIISESIRLFDLDLKGLTVLTEAASGSFYVTPVIAARAGAQVRAYVKDSPYGTKEEVKNHLGYQSEKHSVSNFIEIIDILDEETINSADIVTNLGLLRPLNASFLKAMKKNGVITCMCEEWEVRDEDIDKQESLKQGIPIGAVNEESPLKNIFRYVGDLAVKLINEAGLPVKAKRFLIISSDKFGKTVREVLKGQGADVDIIETNCIKRSSTSHQEGIGENDGYDKHYEALIIADFSFRSSILSIDGLLNAKELIAKYPDSQIIHLAGAVDSSYLLENGIRCYPPVPGYSQRMSKTLDYLDIRPVIELHTAGLKVGELLFQQRRKGLKRAEIKRLFSGHPLCQIV